MKTITGLLTVAALLMPALAWPQQRTGCGDYIRSYGKDAAQLIKAPLTWDRQDAEAVTLIAGATAFVMLYDDRLDDFVRRNHSEALRSVSKFGLGPFGNGVYSLPLLGAVYLGGVAGRNEYDKKMALLGLKTFLFSAGEATVAKWAFQRHRPGAGSTPEPWTFDGPFGNQRDEGAFVSRHAATSFALASLFAEGYGHRKKWVPVVAYTLASLVTVSRVYEREHWASDALTGACLGYVTGKFLFRINRQRLNGL